MFHLQSFAILAVYLASTLVWSRPDLEAQASNPSPLASIAASPQASPNPVAIGDPIQPTETRGDLFMARGNYAEALEIYLQVAPRSAVILNKIGIAYHHLFALDEALKYYQSALTLNPHYSEAYNNIGAVYHGKSQFSLAVKAYKRSLKYQPREAVAYCNLGTAYFAETKYKKGIEAYRKAYEIDPAVFNRSGRSSIEEGASREQRMATAFYLAEVYARAGKNDEALAALRRALSNGFNDRKRLMGDKELASLRETPEFHQLMVEEHLE